MTDHFFLDRRALWFGTDVDDAEGKIAIMAISALIAAVFYG